MMSDFDVNRFLCDLPWVTSISPDRSVSIPPILPDSLFINSADNDLNSFAREIKLDSSSPYIFSDVGTFDLHAGKIGNHARVLISFVAPIYGKRLTLRVKHSGEEDGPLEIALRSTKIHLNPSSKTSITMDDIILYPIQFASPSDLSFMPEVRNEIFIRFKRPAEHRSHHHFLNDVELLDEAGLEYMPRSASLSRLSN